MRTVLIAFAFLTASAGFALADKHHVKGIKTDGDGGSPPTEMLSVEGGQMIPASEYTEAAPFQRARFRSGTKYWRFECRLSANMGADMAQWIGGALDGKPYPHDGSIIVVGDDGKELMRADYEGALLSEVAFPRLDASAKEAGWITIQFEAASVKITTADPSELPPGSFYASDPNVQKKWLPSNFRLAIDGIGDDSLRRVNSIEAIVIKQRIAAPTPGQPLAYEKEPAHLEVPNLVFAGDYDPSPFLKDLQATLAGRDVERTVVVTYLGDGDHPLFDLTLSGFSVDTAIGLDAHDAPAYRTGGKILHGQVSLLK